MKLNFVGWWFSMIVGILHQNFKLFPSFSLPHTMIEEALTCNLVFVL